MSAYNSFVFFLTNKKERANDIEPIVIGLVVRLIMFSLALIIIVLGIVNGIWHTI